MSDRTTQIAFFTVIILALGLLVVRSFIRMGAQRQAQFAAHRLATANLAAGGAAIQPPPVPFLGEERLQMSGADVHGRPRSRRTRRVRA